jgi:FemAB-related protein (PEP-CTERM system-associated)
MTEIVLNPGQAAWDDYAEKNSAATFSHRFDWGESLAAVYQVPIFRLAAKRQSGDTSLAGILPLMLFAAPDRDDRLVSLPYTDAAGIVADDTATGTRLLAAALDLAVELGAVHVELRQAGSPIFQVPIIDSANCWNHTPHAFKTGLRRPLPESSDELWSLLPAKVRNQVRKARTCGCTVAIGGPEKVDDFYAVFSENMRDLGSPVHEPELFRMLLGKHSLGSRVIVVSLLERPVAVAIVFTHNATLFNPWASSLRRYRPSCPNMLLYWAMLELAVEYGCRWFDFGRSSPDAPTHRFKRQWGAAMQPLAWHVFSRQSHSWDPRSETLVDASWKSLDLSTSRQNGPARRRWISL